MLPERHFERLLKGLSAAERPEAGLLSIHSETVVAADIDRTFAFFCDARNLEQLTPAWINFKIRTPLPIEMCEGAIIDYEIVLRGVPLPWRTRIDVWEPGVRFIDRQLAGPYLWWHHEHRFEAAAAGTRVIDHVEFLPRAARLTAAIVKRDVGRIFTFRQRALASVLTSNVVQV